MTRLADLRAHLRDLCDRSTPGPWRYTEDGPGARLRVILGTPGIDQRIATGRRSDRQRAEVAANWRLMAVARAAIPALLDALDDAEAEITETCKLAELYRSGAGPRSVDNL